MHPPPSYRLCGFKITPTTADDLFALMDRAVAHNDRMVIASQNLHGLYMHSRDSYFRILHDDARTCVHIDGMPIIWLGRLFGLNLKAEQRTAWIDWFLPLMEHARDEGWRVFYLGGRKEVVERGLSVLRRDYPGLEIEGRDGFFDAEPGSEGNRAVIERINRFRPHILIVGMGMGRQERWIVENRTALEANCIGTSGACLEYFAGAVRMPPRWLGRIGFEWAFRLIDDPRRFWRRYLVEPWSVAWSLLRSVARRRGAVERIEARTGT